jgi:predicted dehydrogenase
MGVAKTDCRVAVIGAGYTAREHLKAFADVQGVRLVGIHSRTRSRAETLANEFGVPVVSDSVDELYTRTTPDLVVMTVPELEARRVAIQCFAQPWTILMEKPAGYDLADATVIFDAAVSAGADRRTFVALNRRFHSSTRTVLEDLATGDGVRFIKVQDQEDLVAAAAAGQPELVVENWMYANSIHVIDYFRVLGRGAIDEINVSVPFARDAPGPMVCTLRFSSGDIGLYEGIWNAPAPWAVNVIVPTRRWELRPLERAAFQNRGERAVQNVDPHAWDVEFKPGFRAQAAAAVQAALGRPSESIPLSDALETMRLIHKMFV